MRERIYIETTIPSFYFNTRTNEAMRLMGEWTQRWWDKYRFGYDLYTSVVVLAELDSGNHPLRSEKMSLLEGLPVFRRNEQVDTIAREYVRTLTMPSDPVADAEHLAFASVQQCQILLTWNCSHLANHRKMKQVMEINRRLGVSTPLILTPFQLLAEEKGEI